MHVEVRRQLWKVGSNLYHVGHRVKTQTIWLELSRVILSAIFYFLNQAGDPPGLHILVCFCFRLKSQTMQQASNLVSSWGWPLLILLSQGLGYRYVPPWSTERCDFFWGKVSHSGIIRPCANIFKTSDLKKKICVLVEVRGKSWVSVFASSTLRKGFFGCNAPGWLARELPRVLPLSPSSPEEHLACRCELLSSLHRF